MSLLRRLTNRFAIERDLRQWRRWMKPARSAGSGERAVLVCDLMSGLAVYKAQALYVRALRDHGFTPVVLLPGPNRWAERIYSAAGPTQFLYFTDFIDQAAEQAATVEADCLMAEDPRLDRLLHYEKDGVRIGRNALSLALRRLRAGRLDASDPEQRKMIREVLIRSLVAAAAGARLVAQVRPALSLFNERGYTPAGEVFDCCLAAGVDVVQWLGAPQADRLLFKRYRMANRAQHPLALEDETWTAMLGQPWEPDQENALMELLASNYISGAWFNRQQLQEGKLHQPPEQVRAELGLVPGRKLATIFCHILYDATFFYGDSLFRDYEEWLVETVRAAIANPAMDWVVKVHPVNVWRSKMDGVAMEQLEVQTLRKAFGTLPPHVKIMPADTKVNTWSLFHAIDYGLTVRGTVGMELPCLGVPMVTAGTGRYGGRGFTIDPATPGDYRALLGRLHEVPLLDPATVSLARRYAWGTFFRRPIRLNTFRLDFTIEGRNPLLSPNVLIFASPDQGGDLRRLAGWMAEGRQLDYLDDPS